MDKQLTVEHNQTKPKKDFNDIVPKDLFENWQNSKDRGPNVFGEEIVKCLSRAIAEKYLPKGGLQDPSNIGSTNFDNHPVIMYWKFERDGKVVCLPVIGQSKVFDQNGVEYDYENRNGGASDFPTLDFGGKHDDFFRNNGLLIEGEVAPSMLQVSGFRETSSSFKKMKESGSKYKDFNKSSYKPNKFQAKVEKMLPGLKWSLEKRNASSVIPWQVIEDLKLLK